MTHMTSKLLRQTYEVIATILNLVGINMQSPFSTTDTFSAHYIIYSAKFIIILEHIVQCTIHTPIKAGNFFCEHVRNYVVWPAVHRFLIDGWDPRHYLCKSGTRVDDLRSH